MTEGKAVGRSQLKGLLDNLVQKSIEERDDNITVDEDVEEAARDLMELNDDGHKTRKRKQSRLPLRKRKKRMRKERIEPERKLSPDNIDETDEDRYIPHVMTLFDRKVDLAQFSMDTPLYVMCREWMTNNPHKNNPSVDNDYGSLITTHTSTLNHTVTPQTSLTLPLPTPLPTDKEGSEVRIDIPKPHPPISTGIEEIEKHINEAMTDTAGDLTTYKREHLRRWKDVRRRWTVASAQNQLRYDSSLRILRGMFQRM